MFYGVTLHCDRVTGLFIYRQRLVEGGLKMIKINPKLVDDCDSPSEERAFEDFSLLEIRFFASRCNNKLG